MDGNNSESTAQTVKQKWNGLTPTTKYIIIGVVAGVALLCLAIFAFCCIRQRRAGKHERLIEDAKYEQNAAEVMAYRSDMSRVRGEKMQGDQIYVTPMGNVSPMHHNYGQTQPMMGGMSPTPGHEYPHSDYARSVSTFGSGRGYQKY